MNGMNTFRVILILGALLCVRSVMADVNTEDSWVREIRVGFAAHDVPELWSGTEREYGTDYLFELVFASPFAVHPLLGMHTYVGFTANHQGFTSKIYTGFSLRLMLYNRVYAEAGLGLAVHDGEIRSDLEDRKDLGSRILFRVPLEIGFIISRSTSISFYFDHISNANTAKPNYGMDMVGFRVGYRL